MVRKKGLLLSWFVCLALYGQSQYNGLLQRNDITDVSRVQQLLDTTKAKERNLEQYSFTIRPIHPFAFEDPKKNWIMLRQFGYTRYMNDSLAGGYNNESFFQAAGAQTRITGGVAAKIGRLMVEFQPEWVQAENTAQHDIDPSFTDPNFFSRNYFWNINPIDLPSQFGKDPIKKFYLGQSSIKFTFNQFAIGASNENVWWGPGMKNALVMTNNANGFKHLTLHTIKPLKTPVGSFETQVVIGRLDSSGIEPVENERQRRLYWADAYKPKPLADRKLVGYVITYQPKWIKNLFIGVAAATNYYFKNIYDSLGNSKIHNYPWYAKTEKGDKQVLGSIFFRYAMPADKAEIYGEFGRSDRRAAPWNVIGDTIPFGYIFGIRKWIRVSNSTQAEFMAEVAQLALPDSRLIFDEAALYGLPKVNGYYTHPVVRHGYTHNGQMLGAGIGPGSNSQYLSISLHRRGSRLGIHGERIVHNNDFVYAHYLSTVGRGYHNRYYVDLIYGAHLQVKVGGIYVAGAINFMNALNYKWVKLGGTFETGSPLSDKKNVQASMSILYDLNMKQSFKMPKFMREGWQWLKENI
jgi:hypothetical protein